jgi:hypothetical protein
VIAGAAKHAGPAAKGVLVAFPVLIVVSVLALVFTAMRQQQKGALTRDLLAHKIFRTLEDAVAEQGVASHYRVAPGRDAAVPDERLLDEAEPSTQALARLRA